MFVSRPWRGVRSAEAIYRLVYIAVLHSASAFLAHNIYLTLYHLWLERIHDQQTLGRA